MTTSKRLFCKHKFAERNRAKMEEVILERLGWTAVETFQTIHNFIDVLPEADAPKKNDGFEQLDIFTDYSALEAKQERERAELERERKMQQDMLTIKKKFVRTLSSRA